MDKALFGQFKIYPRGFLGAFRPPVLLKKPGFGRSQKLQYDTSLFDANDTRVVVANTAIEELYKRMITRESTVDRFDFREQILKEALMAFGTRDFGVWYKAQFNSPSFGETHRDFLDDCLRFIRTGQRSVAVNIWGDLLETTDNPVKNEQLGEQARWFFGEKEFVSQIPSADCHVAEVIQMWVSKPNGISDLLYSTHILFGLAQ